MSRLDRLIVYVNKAGPSLLFPRSARDVDVRNLCRLKTEGASNKMYSFHITYSLEGRKHQTALILRMYGSGEERERAVRKEFALLKALKEQKIPVPSVYLLETSKEIMERPFMIMEQIVGKSASHFLYDRTTAMLTVDKLAKSLATVHKLNSSSIKSALAPGLFAEQHEFAQRQLAHALNFINRMCRSSFPPIRRRRYLDALEQLKKVRTSKHFRSAILHGDFTSDHVLMTKDGPVIIDWEDAIVGDPAYEVGFTYHTLMWIGRNQIDHRIIKSPRTVDVDLKEHFVRCYEKYMGHKLSNLEFYKDLAALKLTLHFDGRLRPGAISPAIIPLGLKGRLFGTVFVRNRMRPFFDYCIQHLESKGILL